MASRDGNGWVRCSLGHRHWGKFGAAGLLAYAGEPGETQILLQRRAGGVTTAAPGGCRAAPADSHESAVAAALREAAEECGVPRRRGHGPRDLRDDHGGWAYQTVLRQGRGAVRGLPGQRARPPRSTGSRPTEVGRAGLHPGLAAHWAELRAGLLR